MSTNNVVLVVALGLCACGSVDEKRHLDGGMDGQGSADAAPMGPPNLTVTPGDHMFGPVPLSTTSAAFTFTFKNTGGDPATGCSAPVLGGANAAAFRIATDNCGTADLAGGATCTVDVTANPINDALITMTLTRACTAGGTASTTANGTEANRPMYIFITAAQSNGNLGGLVGADAKCQIVGNAGTVTGGKNLTWKALLSQTTGTAVNAKDRFVWTGPVFDTKGFVVTRNPSVWPWLSTTTGGSPEWDESGIQGPSYAFNGSTLDGVASTHGDCHGWADGTQTYHTYAGQAGYYPNTDWLESFDTNCSDTFYSIYCVSQ